MPAPTSIVSTRGCTGYYPNRGNQASYKPKGKKPKQNKNKRVAEINCNPQKSLSTVGWDQSYRTDTTRFKGIYWRYNVHVGPTPCTRATFDSREFGWTWWTLVLINWFKCIARWTDKYSFLTLCVSNNRFFFFLT